MRLDEMRLDEMRGVPSVKRTQFLSYFLTPNIGVSVFAQDFDFSGIQDISAEYGIELNANLEKVDPTQLFEEMSAEAKDIFLSYMQEIKKSCYRENTKIYENLYFYNENRITRSEKYSRDNCAVLWTTEHYEYYDNKIEKSVYLANGILSHYIVMEVENDTVISKSLKSPAKSKYCWEISWFDNDSCTVYVAEDCFDSNVLLDIANYIIQLTGHTESSEIISIIIVCSDTEGDDSIVKVERQLRKRGVSIMYSP